MVVFNRFILQKKYYCISTMEQSTHHHFIKLGLLWPLRYSQSLKWLIAGILMIVVINLKAQDPIFSQFYLSPLQLNPGLTGITDGPRFSVNYRNQFPGFNNAYRTYALSYDQFFDQMNSGVGFWLLSDDAGGGILKTIKAAGIYSYQVRVRNDVYMRMGIEVGVVQTTLNWDKLRFGDQIDDYLGAISPGGTPFPTEEFAPEKNSIVYPDLGLGFLFNNKTFYTGLSVRHINTPKPEFLGANPHLTEGIPMRWTAHAGASFPVFSNSSNKKSGKAFLPSIIYVLQGPFQQINGGVTFDAGVVSFGGYYRLSSGQSEALIASIGLRTNQLKIGYSYDVTLSGFPTSGGTHELGLVYALQVDHSNSKYSDCLRLFR